MARLPLSRRTLIAAVGLSATAALPKWGAAALAGSTELADELPTRGAGQGPLVVEPAEFAAPDGVILRGAMYASSDVRPRAAVVVVHGAGQAPSRYEDWASIYAGAGFAALIYDKRGCGVSGGEYEASLNTSAANLLRLTGDAVAAAGWLRSCGLPAHLPFGFAGPSQAGWIIPPAVVLTHADFMLLFSAPTCTTSQSQEFEAGGIGRAMRYARFLRDESETDPMSLLRAIDTPGFWNYGAQDVQVPVALCIRNLDSLISQGHEYEYFIDPNSGHLPGEAAHRRAIDWFESRFAIAGERQKRARTRREKAGQASATADSRSNPSLGGSGGAASGTPWSTQDSANIDLVDEG